MVVRTLSGCLCVIVYDCVSLMASVALLYSSIRVTTCHFGHRQAMRLVDKRRMQLAFTIGLFRKTQDFVAVLPTEGTSEPAIGFAHAWVSPSAVLKSQDMLRLLSSAEPFAIPLDNAIKYPPHPLTPLDPHRQHALYPFHSHSGLQYTDSHLVALA